MGLRLLTDQYGRSNRSRLLVVEPFQEGEKGNFAIQKTKWYCECIR
jgi:hypothetical protein